MRCAPTTTLPPPPRSGAPLKRGSRIHDHSWPAGFTRFGGSPGEISRTKRAGEGVIARRSPIGAEDRRCAGVRRSTTEKEAGDALRHEENINTTFTIPYLTDCRPWSIF